MAHLGAAELDRCLLDAQERTSLSEGDTSEKRHKRVSFDDIVGTGEQRRWDFDAQCSGSLEVYD